MKQLPRLFLLVLTTLTLDPLNTIQPVHTARVPQQRPFSDRGDGRTGLSQSGPGGRLRGDQGLAEGDRRGRGYGRSPGQGGRDQDRGRGRDDQRGFGGGFEEGSGVDMEWRVDGGRGGGGAGCGMRENPYLKTHREQFSGIDHDTSQSLYNRFHKLAYSNLSSSSSFSSAPTSFTMTQDPTFNLVPFAQDPENTPIIHIREIEGEEGEEVRAGKTVFRQVGRRREGVGIVGAVRDFTGWEVEWRGLRFEVWQSMYFDTMTYRYITQSHILGFHPPDIFPYTLDNPLPPPNLKLNSTATTTTQQDGTRVDTLWSAREAADLLILEVGVWSSKIGETILVFDNGWWEKDHQLWESVQKADWKDVILPSALQHSIKHEYASFFSSESIYKDLGVAWKRGVIFLGPPGNGKTISVKAMMRDVLLGDGGVGKEEEKRVLYVRSFHTPWGDEHGISEIFSRARKEAPCLVVFEDIDSLVDDHNRSFFLNEVDGLEDNDGLLMLATTNHFDRLDPALSNRPSRFDRKYNFPDPVKHERRQYALYWQNKLQDNDRVEFPDRLLDDFAGKTEGFSFAYMKEAFVSALLILAGDESNDKRFPTELMSQVKALRDELDSEKLRLA